MSAAALKLDIQSSAVFRVQNGANGVGAIDLGTRVLTLAGGQYTGKEPLVSVDGGVGVEGEADFLLVPLSQDVTDQAYYTFRDVTADGIEDLIIDWRSSSGSQNFQATIELGSAERNGTIQFNYQDVAGIPNDSMTVRIKNHPGQAATGLYVRGGGDFALRSGTAILLRDSGATRVVERIAGIAHVFGTAGDDNLWLSEGSNEYRIERNGQRIRINPAGLNW
jgi:hypothetical protein